MSDAETDHLHFSLGDVFESSRFPGISYAIEARIGSGGFGNVVRARCRVCSTSSGPLAGAPAAAGSGGPKAGAAYAIKIVRAHPAYTSQASVEVNLLAHLSRLQSDSGAHKGVITLVDHFSHDGHLCLVVELLPGTLLDVLAARDYVGLPLHVIETILKSLLETLHDLHTIGLMHADVKPENVMLAGPGSALLMAAENASCATSLPRSARSSESLAAQVELATNRSSRAATPHVEVEVVGSDVTTALRPDSPPLSTGAPAFTAEDARSMAENAHLRPLPSLPISTKLIDFGSAGYEEGCTLLHEINAYAQSRFYRAPEVLLGLPHTGAIDLWGVGCIAVELWLGLPLFAGFNDHDCLTRMCIHLGLPPDEQLLHAPLAGRFFVPRSRGAAPVPFTPSVPDFAFSSRAIGGENLGPSVVSMPHHERLRSMSAAQPPTAYSRGTHHARIQVSPASASTNFVAIVPSADDDAPPLDGGGSGTIESSVVGSTRTIMITPPTANRRAPYSQLRLSTPSDFFANERQARAGSGTASADASTELPHPSAKHYLRPLPLVALLVSHDERAGLLPSLIPSEAARLRSDIRVVLEHIHADTPAPRWSPPVRNAPVQRISVEVPADISEANLAKRIAFADLVARLLVYEPSARLTAAEALALPFFLSSDNAPIASRVIENNLIRRRRGDLVAAESSRSLADGAPTVFFSPARQHSSSFQGLRTSYALDEPHAP